MTVIGLGKPRLADRRNLKAGPPGNLQSSTSPVGPDRGLLCYGIGSEDDGLTLLLLFSCAGLLKLHGPRRSTMIRCRVFRVSSLRSMIHLPEPNRRFSRL